MTREQAKETLYLYRPGTADPEDPSFSQALLLCESDAELREWFQEHCEVYLVLRKKFKQVAIPGGLKEQILAEKKVHVMPAWRRPVPIAAAAVMLLLGILLATFWVRPKEDTTLSGFRQRMVSTALRSYGMDVLTHNPAQVAGYFRQRNWPADYNVPEKLAATELAGCAALTWQGEPVSMICFRSGRPLSPGQSSDLWLFVIDVKSVPGASARSKPAVATVSGAATATWSQGGKLYVLASDGDEAFLRNFL